MKESSSVVKRSTAFRKAPMPLLGHPTACNVPYAVVCRRDLRSTTASWVSISFLEDWGLDEQFGRLFLGLEDSTIAKLFQRRAPAAAILFHFHFLVLA